MNYKDDRRTIKTIPNDPEDDIVKPKVLFACINAPSYSPAGQIDGFKRAGYDVIPFDWQHIRYEIGVEDMLERLLVKAITEQPELIFLQFQNGDILDVETAKELSKYGFVVSFSEDVREDISWYEEIAPHIGLTVFTNIDDVEKLKSKGINNAAYIPTSYNHILYKPIEPSLIDERNYWMPHTKDYGEVIFIGNNYLNTNLNFPQAQERQDMIAFMEKEFGNKFQAYGLGQENKMLNMNECVEAYNNCKIAITHNNFLRNGYTSDRLFNSIGAGAFTISQYFAGIEKLNLMPLAKWRDFNSLKVACKFFLEHDKDRIKIASKSYEQIINYHQWHNRIEKLKTIIKEFT